MRPADVVVIGGGIIGCAVAYYAARRGLRVTLVDRPRRGRATAASAGGLWPIGETVGLGCGVIFHKSRTAPGAAAGHAAVPTPLPAAFLDFAMRSNAMHPGLAEELREASGIDVEWERTSLLFVMYDDGDVSFGRSVQEQYPAARDRMEWMTREELTRAEPAVTPETRGGLMFLGDDQVNPYRLADALRASARAYGASFVAHTDVTGLRIDGGRVTGVELATGSIACDVVVNAAGAWAAEIGRMAGLAIPVRPVRGQLLGTEALPKLLSACLSTADCYLLQKGHGEVIIGSTTEEVGFDASVTAPAMRTLAAGAVRAVPSLEHARLKRTWAGLRPGTPDELPILGPAAGLGGYLNACGHFRTGILNAPLTGLLLAELAAGDETSVPIEPFLLARFT